MLLCDHQYLVKNSKLLKSHDKTRSYWNYSYSDQTHYTTLLIRKVSGTSKNSGFLEETNLAS